MTWTLGFPTSEKYICTTRIVQTVTMRGLRHSVIINLEIHLEKGIVSMFVQRLIWTLPIGNFKTKDF